MHNWSFIPGGRSVGRRSRRLTIAASLGLLLAAATGGRAQTQTAARELAIKYTRDSAEYAALARQVYRVATDVLLRSVPVAAGHQWAVILDVDETALDNSAYQLERAAYDLPFDASSWSAWIRRRQAAVVPGSLDFVTAVRNAGGHVAWITNRTAAEADDTRANLRQVQLWSDDDRLCAQDDPLHTKRFRRAEVVAGKGNCAWVGEPMHVLAIVGDQMSDFPEPDEPLPGADGDAAFGRTCFLLPNPMYGAWTTRVTRTAR